VTGVVVAGLLAGWAVAVPVGAIGAHLVALSTSAPWRTGVAAALGVACADGAYALVAVLGGAAVAAAVAQVAGPLRWLSAGVLLALAVRTAVVALRPVGAGPALAGREAFLRLFALTLVNPMTVLLFSALVLGLQDQGSRAQQLLFAASAFAASASWQLVLVGVGASLGRVLTGRRGRLATGLVSSAVIAGLALDVVLR
jgi:threonine/homoserine/homoserine lactone efflux protein